MAHHIVVIDTMNLFFRAYFAVRELSRADGLPTNALYGMAQMLYKVIKDLKPDVLVAAIDSGGDNFRHALYPAYKANRSAPEENMVPQFPHLRPMLEAFGVTCLQQDGVEADDLIASLVMHKDPEDKISIVSSDKDLLQLIRPGVVMVDTMKGVTLGDEAALEKFGVPASRVVEAQGLIGDSSDNIPGVKGIGPKTAAELINAYGTLEELYAHIDEITKPKLKEALVAHKDIAFLSRQLAQLKGDIPPPPTPPFKIDVGTAKDFLLGLEFTTLAARLNDVATGVNGRAAQKPENTFSFMPASPYETVTTVEALQGWIDRCYAAGTFALDTETNSLSPQLAELVGISLSDQPGKACYIPLTHHPLALQGLEQIDRDETLRLLKPLLESQELRKVGHNIKYDMQVLARYGIALEGIEDTMLMSFSLYGGLHNHGLDDLCERYLNHKNIAYKDVCGTGQKQITFDQVPLDRATAYAAEDADMALRLYKLFLEKLMATPSLLKVYEELERPLVPVLAAMETAGIEVNTQALKKLGDEFGRRMEQHRLKVMAIAGTEFNLNSPKQLGEILFEKLQLPGGKKTATGYGTDVSVLEKLEEDGHEIAVEILAYRKLAKLNSTYVESLQQEINPKTGRVHTSYNQTGAATGRLSSSDPNLQNIPIRTEDGRKIRHAFVAKEGCTLMSVDYAQIELRLLAHAGNVEPLIEAFQKGEDIHKTTGELIFAGDTSMDPKERRRAAKIVNFGLLYGMGAFSMAQQIGVSRAKGKEIVEAYFTRFPSIKAFMEEQKRLAHKNGYVETLFGRRVWLPGIESKNGGLVAGAERAAINAPLQGSNADIMKLVMPKIHCALKNAALSTQLLLQVHDELVFEVPLGEIEAVKSLVLPLMREVVRLRVPLEISAQTGATWEDAH